MRNWRWLLQRARATSPFELPYRLRNAVRNRLGRYRRWKAAAETAFESVCDAKSARSAGFSDFNDFLRPENRPTFPFVPTDADVARLPDAWRAAALSDAENLLVKRFSFFDLKNADFGLKIDWNRDYRNDKTAPRRYAPSIDFSDIDNFGDVKYVWELGRLQHLPRLARAWRYGGRRDARIPAEIIAQIADFIDATPPMRSIHWASALEIALQLISLTLTFQLLRPGPEDVGKIDKTVKPQTSPLPFPPGFCELSAKAIFQRLRFVDARYSAFSSAGNHLVGEAAGVYIAATYWRPLKNARRFASRAKKILTRELLRQTFPDGVCREQSVSYSFFVRDLFAFAGACGEASGDSFPTSYWARLARLDAFLDAISDRAGNVPNVGDEDDGRVVVLEPRETPPILAIRAATRNLTPRAAGESGAARSEASEKAFWAFGVCASNGPKNPSYSNIGKIAENRPSPPRIELRTFPNGGWQTFRDRSNDGEILFVFKSGPFGYPATAAHAHADASSLLLSLDGVPILIDPGTFTYRDVPERRAFRSSASHNTLNFADSEQSEYINRFLWGKRATAELLPVDKSLKGDIFGGRTRWHTGETVERRVVRLATSNDGGEIDAETAETSSDWEIIDRWRGKVPPTIRFHFAPGLTPERVGIGTFAVETPTRRVIIANTDATVATASFLEDYLASPGYERLLPAKRAIFRAAAPEGETTTTLRIITKKTVKNQCC